MPPQNTPPEHSPKTMPDPTKSSKSWAIAIVVSAVLLLAAAGVVAWIIISRMQTAPKVAAPPPDETKNVTAVSFVPPADLPANYAKNDQSKPDATTVFYYDDATNCGFTVNIGIIPSDKKLAVIIPGLAVVEGTATTKSEPADKISFKDADGSKTYAFDSVALEQVVSVPGVTFPQHKVMAYKQFGYRLASVAYACKNETWDAKKDELAKIMATFTVKTER